MLTYEDVEVPAPGPGQISQEPCRGRNFIDTYFRMGMYHQWERCSSPQRGRG
jgi:hypothetical protein